MSRQVRIVLVLGAIGALGAVLALAIGGMPTFGDFHGVVGVTLRHLSVPQRHTTDVITAINFDYRGLDTMGEEFILFAASVGLVVLLRELRGESEVDDETQETTDDRLGPAPLAGAGRLALVPLIVLGVYIVIHGQLTPGGGFQGGVVLATAAILAAAARSPRAMPGLGQGRLAETLEAVGAGGYAVVGLAGLLSGARFLSDVLPLGAAGHLLSSGTIASLSTIVGLEVAGAITAVTTEFAIQQRVRG